MRISQTADGHMRVEQEGSNYEGFAFGKAPKLKTGGEGFLESCDGPALRHFRGWKIKKVNTFPPNKKGLSGKMKLEFLSAVAEIVTERWTPLVLRELLVRGTRFNDIRRGVPRMSPSLLAKRLRGLQQAAPRLASAEPFR